MTLLRSTICIFFLLCTISLVAQSQLEFTFSETPHNFSALDSTLRIKEAYQSGASLWVVTSNGTFQLDLEGNLIGEGPLPGWAGFLWRRGEIIGYESRVQNNIGIHLTGGEGRIKSDFSIPAGMGKHQIVPLDDRITVYTHKYWSGPFVGTLGNFKQYDFSGNLLHSVELDQQINHWYATGEGYTGVAGQDDEQCGNLIVYNASGEQVLAQLNKYSLHWMDPEAKRLLLYTSSESEKGARFKFHLFDEAGRELNSWNTDHWVNGVEALGNKKYILFRGEDETLLLDWSTGEELWKKENLPAFGICLSWDQKTLFRLYATPETEAQGITYTVTSYDLKTGEETGIVDIFRDSAHFDEAHNRFEQIGKKELEFCDSKGCFQLQFKKK